MKIYFFILSLIFLLGCKKEDIEIANQSKSAELELSFEGNCNSLFYSKLKLDYPDHTENYQTGSANQIKYSFTKSPIQGNQTITFSSQFFLVDNSNHQPNGACIMKILFNGQVVAQKDFPINSEATITADLPYIQ